MNIFDLVATLSLNKDGYDSGLSSAETRASTFGGKVGKTMSAVAKTTAVAVGAAATAIGAVTKQAVESYAQYEQLVGGVETLFGAQGQTWAEYAQSMGVTSETSKQKIKELEDKYHSLQKAQRTVLNDASEAYKTAGLSANEYMESVTSVAAALNSSLGGDTEASAKKANQAIIDMSDNANKMGTSMESIQNAYNGFAKQNYTMLDNLKLGYGGTKEEMQRLLSDAEKLPSAMGKKFDLSNYADIVDAIHLVQTEMGITGTTEKEAATTISGSLGMVKAAWTNLVTGIADDEANFDSLINNMVESVTAFGENIIPRIQIALEGVGNLISQVLPIVMEKIPSLISDTMPQLLQSGISMVSTIVEGIGKNSGEIVKGALSIIKVICDALSGDPAPIINAGLEMLQNLMEGVIEAIPMIAEAAINIIENLANYIRENLPTIIETGLTLIQNFATTLAENAGLLIDAAMDLMMGLAEGLIEALPVLIEMLPVIIDTFANIINDNMPKIIETGIQIIIALVKGIIDCIPVIVENIPMIIKAIWDTITAVNWINLGSNIMNFFKNGITGAKANVAKGAKELIENFKGGFKNLPNAMKQIAKNVIDGFVTGIKNNIMSVVKAVTSLATSVIDTVRSIFGIASPSKEFKKIGNFLAQGLEVGWEDGMVDTKNAITSDLNFSAVPSTVGSIAAGGFDTSGIIDAINSKSTNITITLEGDARRLFKAMQSESKMYYNTTGMPAFN